jgi:uncharacterized protein YdbL (DUF1318 family)
MKKLSLTVLTLAALLLATPAFALDLHGARAQGLVGEKADGYVTAQQPSAEVNALVDDVNARRKAEYARISKENGQPLDVVGRVAAESIVGKLESGASYQGADGSWKKK